MNLVQKTTAMLSRVMNNLTAVFKIKAILWHCALRIVNTIESKINNMYEALTVMFVVTFLFGTCQIYSYEKKIKKHILTTVPVFKIIPLSYLSIYIVSFIYGSANSDLSKIRSYFGDTLISMLYLLDMLFGVVYVCTVYISNSLAPGNIKILLEKITITDLRFGQLGYKVNYKPAWVIHFFFLLALLVLIFVNVTKCYNEILLESFISPILLRLVYPFSNCIVLITTYQFCMMIFLIHQILQLIYQILHQIVIDTNDRLKGNRLLSTITGQF